jgi:hypothetical protein
VGGEPEGVGGTVEHVPVVSNSGGEERFTTERDAPLSVGDIFAQEADSYRVLAIQPGHGPFDGVVEAEWPRLAVQPLEFVTQLSNSGSRSTPLPATAGSTRSAEDRRDRELSPLSGKCREAGLAGTRRPVEEAAACEAGLGSAPRRRLAAR